MNYVISYPRSGNTALRYIIELLTKLPTNGICGDINPKDRLQKPLLHSGDDYILHKRHDFYGVTDKDFIFFIVRDYLECIIRHNEKPGRLNNIEGHIDSWFSLLADYDSHMINGNGMVIYYDELVKVADRASLSIYPDPQSTGPEYHQAKLGRERVEALRRYANDNYSELIKKYGL